MSAAAGVVRDRGRAVANELRGDRSGADAAFPAPGKAAAAGRRWGGRGGKAPRAAGAGCERQRPAEVWDVRRQPPHEESRGGGAAEAAKGRRGGRGYGRGRAPASAGRAAAATAAAGPARVFCVRRGGPLSVGVPGFGGYGPGPVLCLWRWGACGDGVRVFLAALGLGCRARGASRSAGAAGGAEPGACGSRPAAGAAIGGGRGKRKWVVGRGRWVGGVGRGWN